MILEELLAAVARREPVVLAIVVASQRSVPRRAGSKMLVHADGRTSGSIGGGELEARVVAESMEAMESGRPRRLTYELLDPATGDPGVCGGEVELYLEPHMPLSTLFVMGAGHVGRAVAELGDWLGYRVVVWDDRRELIEEVPGATTTLSGSIDDAISDVPVDEQTRVIMVTRNVALDTEMLPSILATAAPYVGVMGSGRRWATTRKLLTEAGVTEESLARVQTPIGLEISAETPLEIAVSILAQVIGHERGG